MVINRREVTYEEGSEFAKKNKMLFFECSAKTGYNIDEVFFESAKAIIKRINEKYYDLNSEVKNLYLNSRHVVSNKV